MRELLQIGKVDFWLMASEGSVQGHLIPVMAAEACDLGTSQFMEHGKLRAGERSLVQDTAFLRIHPC